MKDIAPELYNRIMDEYRAGNRSDKVLMSIVNKVKAGKGTQKDIARIADRLGKHASDAFKDVLRLESLPNETLYWNIADKTIKPALNATWDEVSKLAAVQMKSKDKVIGLNIGVKVGVNPERRIRDVMNMAVGQTSQEALDNALTGPVIAASRKFYDDFQMSNADMRDALGFSEQVIRTYDDVGLHDGKTPCEWCLARQGTFTMSEAHELGVFERHPGCGCTIEVITPDNTKLQTDWTRNEWTEV